MAAIEYVHREGCPQEGEYSSDGKIWRCRDCHIRTRVA